MNINNFTVRNITEPVNISVTTNGTDRRTKIVYVDVYLPLINEKYNIEGSDSLNDGEKKILAMFASYIDKAEELGRGDERVMSFIETLKWLKKNKKAMREYKKLSKDKEDGIIIGESRGREEGIIIGESLGRKEGIAIGESRGREENQIEIAKAMLKDGLDHKTISKYTALSLEQIESIII